MTRKAALVAACIRGFAGRRRLSLIYWGTLRGPAFNYPPCPCHASRALNTPIKPARRPEEGAVNGQGNLNPETIHSPCKPLQHLLDPRVVEPAGACCTIAVAPDHRQVVKRHMPQIVQHIHLTDGQSHIVNRASGNARLF